MPTGGPTAIRGFNFQYAASALQVVKLIAHTVSSVITFEGPTDSADFSAVLEGDVARTSYQFKTKLVGSWKPSEIKTILNKWLDCRQLNSDQLIIQLQGLPGPSLQSLLIPQGSPNIYVPKPSIVARRFEYNTVRIEFGFPDASMLLNSVESVLHDIYINPALYLNVRNRSNDLIKIICDYSELTSVESRTVAIDNLALKIGIVRNAARGSVTTINFNTDSQLRQALVDEVLAFVDRPTSTSSLTVNSCTTLILHGPSGIGKSHLRREISRRVQNQFLRVVEIESAPNSNTLATLTTAVESIGTPSSRIISSEEAIRSLQSLLSEIDVLICDNFEDDGAVKAIDSIAGTCKVVVLRTSGRSADRITTVPIPAIEHGFFNTCIHPRTISGRQCARSLDSWCKGWPILITAVLAQLDKLVSDGMSLDNACELLATDLAVGGSAESENLEQKLHSLVTRSLADVTQPDFKRLMDLCCLERPISIDALLLEHIWQLDSNRTLASLGRLAERGLVLVSSEGVDIHDAILAAIFGISGLELVEATHEGILTSCPNSKAGNRYLQRFGAIHQYAIGDWWTCANAALSKLGDLAANPSLPTYLEIVHILNKVLRLKVSRSDGSLLAWSLIWAIRSSVTLDSMLSSVDAPLSEYVYGAKVLLASVELVHPQVSATALSALVSSKDGPLDDVENSVLVHSLLHSLQDPRLSPISESALTAIRRLAIHQPLIQPSLGEYANTQMEQLLDRQTPDLALYFIAQTALYLDPQFFDIRRFVEELFAKYLPEELADHWSSYELGDDLTRRLVTTFATVDSDRASLIVERLFHGDELTDDNLETAVSFGRILSGNDRTFLPEDSASIDDETLRDVVLTLTRNERFDEAINLLRSRTRNRWWCGTVALAFAENSLLHDSDDSWEKGVNAALRKANQLHPLSGLQTMADISEVLVRLDRAWARTIASQCLTRITGIEADQSLKLRLEKRLILVMLRAGGDVDRTRLEELLRFSDSESMFDASWISGVTLKQVLAQSVRILPSKFDETNVDEAIEFLRSTSFAPTFDFWAAWKRRYDSVADTKLIRASVSLENFGDALSRDSGIVAEALLALAEGAELGLLSEVAARSFALSLDVAIALTLQSASAPASISVESSKFNGLNPSAQVQLALCLLNGERGFATRLFAKQYRQWLANYHWEDFAASDRRGNMLSPVLVHIMKFSIALDPVLQSFHCDEKDMPIALQDLWSVLVIQDWELGYSATASWIKRELSQQKCEATIQKIASAIAYPFLHNHLSVNQSDVIRQLLSLSWQGDLLGFTSEVFSLQPDQYFDIASQCLKLGESGDSLDDDLREQLADVLLKVQAYSPASLACLVLTAPSDFKARSEYLSERVDEESFALARSICTAIHNPTSPGLIDQIRSLYDDYARVEDRSEVHLEYLSDDLRPEDLFRYLNFDSFQLLIDSKVLLDFIEHPLSIANALRNLIDLAATNATCDDVIQFLAAVDQLRALI